MQESESLLNATRCICLPRSLRNTPSTGVAVMEGRLVRRVISDGPGVQTAAVPRCSRPHLLFHEVLRRGSAFLMI